MKAQMLKIAGVKSEKEFYKKFPDEASFMKAHGKEFKKAMRESKVEKAQVGRNLPTGREMYQQNPLNVPMKNLNINKMMKPVKVPGSALVEKTAAPAPEIPEMSSYVQAAGDVIGGLASIKQQKQDVAGAKQKSMLTGVQKDAIASVPMQPIQRQYIRPEDVVYQPEQMFPSYGVGTNVLARDGAMIGGNPTEIMNTFAPNTIYSDMGYEPLSDSDKVKQFKKGGGLNSGGFADFMTGGGGDVLNSLGDFITTTEGYQDAGSRIGRGVGQAVGTAIGGPVVGKALGFVTGAIGDVLDPADEKIAAYNAQSQQNMGEIMGSQAGVRFQNQFNAFMRDGGQVSDYKWVSHTWQPQVITQFGEHKLSDLLRPPADADMLRAGGEVRNLRKNYMSPEEEMMTQMAFGGQLETTWGGYAEPISQNPYLPGTGQTVMFRGQSHDESDGKGRTGIGVKYGQPDSYTEYAEYGTQADADVEVERNEPAVELPNGDGDNSMVVYGNLKIPNQFLSEIGDPKAKGKKFKSYVKDLSKKEQRQNKIIEKASEQLDELNPVSPFDELKFNSLAANIKGANMKLKEYAEFKQNAAAVQNAINDTAEEMGLDADKLAKGRVAMAKRGAEVPKAQRGIGNVGQNRARVTRENLMSQFNQSASTPNLQTFLPQGVVNELPTVSSPEDVLPAGSDTPPAQLNQRPESTNPTTDGGYKSKYGLTPWPGNVTGLGKKTASSFSVKEWDEIAENLGFTGRGNKEFQEFLLNNPKSRPLIEARHKQLYGKGPFIDSKLGYGWAADELKKLKDVPFYREKAFVKRPEIKMKSVTPKTTIDMSALKTIVPPAKKDNTALINSLLGQAMQYLRPSDVEALDPNQLVGEFYAMSQNQLEPVWAQQLQGRLGTPMDISLQDIVNENEATYRGQQRMFGYNPSAQAALSAQKYAANQKVLGEQFRLNQAEKQRVYDRNREILNQLDLTNMGILDRQYGRQAEALSKTKATTQAALNSIASKIGQNKLENRTLATYENLYNYRFDPRFRAQNYQLAQFNIPTVGSTTATKTAKSGNKVSKKEQRNSSIVKALKNL